MFSVETPVREDEEQQYGEKEDRTQVQIYLTKGRGLS